MNSVQIVATVLGYLLLIAIFYVWMASSSYDEALDAEPDQTDSEPESRSIHGPEPREVEL